MALDRVVTRDADRFPELGRQYQGISLGAGRASGLLTSGALLEQKHGRREMQYRMLLCTKPCYALLGRRTGNSSYVSMPLEVDRSIFSDSVLGRTRLSESRQSFNQQLNSRLDSGFVTSLLWFAYVSLVSLLVSVKNCQIMRFLTKTPNRKSPTFNCASKPSRHRGT